ncbi:uncharacterized protein LOC125371379 [Ricinus communis]|uniref:uncharacterized protein LOC125371379 n=1 Tax=Ricinus communis TaxID=3988 RepID=UPI00201A5A5F|nr:uncharacterized protein LOC125371379 [Ricinus communis]
MVDEHMHRSSRAVYIQNQSMGVDRANASEVRQDTISVAPVCTELPLELAETSSCVLQPYINAVHKKSIPFHQSPIPIVSLPLSAQEVQFSRQPMPENPLGLTNPSIEDLPLPQSRSVQMGGHDSLSQEPSSRANVQDYRSMVNDVGSVESTLLANHVMPEIHHLAWSDPLHIEMERIRKDDEQDCEMHEQIILHIKSERDREIEEVHKKYDMLLLDAERALLHKRKDHGTKFEKVYASKFLAEPLMLKQSNLNAAETADSRAGI